MLKSSYILLCVYASFIFALAINPLFLFLTMGFLIWFNEEKELGVEEK
jgi:hypothetical protein